jgi:organic radical activating enzyme
MLPINNQAPTKADRSIDGSLLIKEIFRTIQGEGPHVGAPSIFVRLGGCNLQCPGCDTDYTTDAKRMTIAEITGDIMLIQNQNAFKPLIVITGGEPFRQNLVPLINRLVDYNYKVQVESNGTLGIDQPMRLSKNAWNELEIVCSPKAGKVHNSLWPFIVAYKYVLNAGHMDPSDGLPSDVLGLPGRPARPHKGYEHKIYIQPADEMNEVFNKRNLDAAIQSCMKFGHRLCVQTHKYINLP